MAAPAGGAVLRLLPWALGRRGFPPSLCGCTYRRTVWHFFPKKWGERRAGGLRPPWPPQYGGSWRRQAVRTGQKTNRALPPVSSAQVSDHSLRRKRQSSLLPLCPCSRRGIAIPGPNWPANRAAPFSRLALSATGGASPGNSPHRTRFAGLRRGPVFTYVTGAAAPRAARIGITLQALWVVALYRLGPPGRRRCHATEILWKSRESGPPPKPSGGNELSGLPGSKRSVA